MFSKRRIIHACLYEFILMILIILSLTFIFDEPITQMGILSLVMALTSVVWNMIFNYFFEKIEHRYQLKRNFFVRVCHAIGFEGGLMLATVPMVAFAMHTSLEIAFFIDFSLTMSILVYTFIFQFCYDKIEARVLKNKKKSS